MDMKIDSLTGDLLFANGECPVTESYEDSVAQRLEVTLRTFLGEWFLQTDIGVPYFEKVFVKQQNKTALDLVFQEQINKDPDVSSIASFQSELRNNREYSVVFSVKTIRGTTTDFITVNPLAQ